MLKLLIQNLKYRLKEYKNKQHYEHLSVEEFYFLLERLRNA